MIPRALSLLAMLSIATALAAQSRDAHALADAFVHALVADSLPALLPIAAADDLDRREWFSLRETIERHRCIVVASYRVTLVESRGDETVIRLELDGLGTMENAARQTRALPREWILRAVATPRGLALRDAMTVQQEAAMRYLRAKTRVERERIFAEDSLEDGRDLLPFIIDIVLADVVVAMRQDAVAIDAATRAGEEVLEDAVEWFARRGDRSSESAALRATSVCVRVRGDFPLAIAYAEAAMQIAMQTNDCDAVAIAQMALGEAIRMSGRMEPALALLLSVGQSADSLDDPRIALRALHNYSIFRSYQADMSESIRTSKEVAAKAAEYGWRQGEGGAWRRLSGIHLDVGEKEDALRYARRASAALLDAGNRAWASLPLSDLAGLTAAPRLFVTAEDLALAAGAPVYALAIAATHANMLLGEGRVEEASCALERVEAAVSPHVAGASMEFRVRAAAVAERSGRWQDGLWQAAKVLASGDEERQFEPHLITGRILHRLGRIGEARQSFEDAVAFAEKVRREVTLDPLRRVRYFAQYADAYYELAALRVEEGDAAGALAATEGLRARSIADALTLGRTDLTAASTTTERRREQQLQHALRDANQTYVAACTHRGDVGAAERAVEKTRAELERFTTELAVRYGSKLPSEPVTAGFADLRTILKGDDGLAVIAYATASESTLAFAASRGPDGDIALHAVRIEVTRAELARRVDALVESVSARRLNHAAKSRAMYDLLVAPLARWIGDAKTIAVVPDGVLWQLPFHVLLDRGREPMVARHAMFYAPSITMLRSVAKPVSAAPPSLLALGNPAFDTTPLRERAVVRDATLLPLPEATDEVRRIAANYARHAVYTGAAADEGRFKKEAGNYRVLHLATHGVLHDRWPMYSAVLLAPSGEEDGVVEAREILELELHADLAVLSACDTARGSIGAGEGVIGMSWALLMAGCPSAVLSQWKAPSASTSGLMIEFHRQLAKRGLTKAESLRQAQLAVRRNPAYRHPFYWAPFILVGAGH